VPDTRTILILSDIHYASDEEKVRVDYEYKTVTNPLLRFANRAFRHLVWMRDPFAHNHLLDKFIAAAPAQSELVVANGDYSCDSAFLGISDDASFISTQQCLGKLKARFGDRFVGTVGDHELGKGSLVGGVGGMRLASWHRLPADLNLKPFWRRDLGNYVLLGVTSSLIALPVFSRDTLAAELPEWERLRAVHLAEIRAAFTSLRPEQRVILFCHDPSALPFLWREDAVREHLPQVEQTIIGHLHTDIVLWKSRVLAGMPSISFLGKSVQRMSSALNEARYWKPFNVRLCRSLSGIQMLKDGGYYIVSLDLEARQPAQFQFHQLGWK
jgi:hypothetical protein